MDKNTPSSSLLALAIIATALFLSLHHTSATSTPKEGRMMSQRCEQQVRGDAGKKIEHCEQYLRSEIKVIMLPSSGNQACCLGECCDMLKEMDEDCVCETVQSLLEEMRESVMVGEGKEVGRMVMRKVMELPMKCGVTAKGCQVRVDRALLDTIY